MDLLEVLEVQGECTRSQCHFADQNQCASEIFKGKIDVEHILSDLIQKACRKDFSILFSSKALTSTFRKNSRLMHFQQINASSMSHPTGTF